VFVVPRLCTTRRLPPKQDQHAGEQSDGKGAWTVNAGDDGIRSRRGGSELDWLLDDFVERVPGASSAIVVAADGLILCISARISGESADQLAAITSGLASLTDGAAKFFAAGSVRQLIVEMDGGFLFVARVSDGSVLALMCESTCDIGLIGYEMSLLIGRIGNVLTPELRAMLRPPIDFGNVRTP
jgi:predicted regulator of Ras-like GTPase activity (Roadblock/LC7/MglB family)